MKKQTTAVLVDNSKQIEEWNIIGLEDKIQKTLREHNHFWWGCVIGLQYGELATIRVNEREIAKGNEFTPIVRIKYNSAYDTLSESRIVKFYPKPKETLQKAKQ